MKFAKAELLSVLTHIKNVTASKSDIVYHRSVCFRNGMVIGFDGITGAVVKFATGLDCCVDADRLYRLVGSLFDEISLEMSGSVLTVSSGRNRTKFQTSATDSGIYSVLEETGKLLDTDEADDYAGLADAVSDVYMSRGDETAKATPFVGIGFRGPHLFSTDGSRMTRRKVSKKFRGTLVVPSKPFRMILGQGSTPRISVRDGSMRVVFREENVVYVTRLLEDRGFPFTAIDDRIDALSGKESVNVEFPEDLARMVQRVKLLNRGGDDGSAVHVSFSRTNGLLTVRDSAKEIGEAEESCEWSAPEDFGFKVDADYLVQVLSRTRKANIVDIVRGKKHVVLFKDDNFDHVLALMR